MKKTIYTLAVTALLAGTILTSCDSPAKKEEEAKENVQEAKQDLKEVQKDANAESERVANAEEWRAFRNETDARITTNEARIAELRIKLKKPGKVLDPLYAQRIEDLQKRNIELRARLDNYEKKQSGWESFKREFNHDMDELGHSLKDFSVDNKK
jgi:hypothetical protein